VTEVSTILPPAAPSAAGGSVQAKRGGAGRVVMLVLKRLVGAAFSLLAVVVLNFFLFNVLSSNPVKAMVRNRHLSAEAQAHLRDEFGYNKSLWVQFWDYMDQLFLHHSLGVSTAYSVPVWQEIQSGIGPTLLLVGIATVLSSVLGTWLGIVGAWRRGSTFDKLTNGGAVTLYAMPEYWIGMIFLLVFGYIAGWFPLSGIKDFTITDVWSLTGILNVAKHLVLPCVTLTLAYLAQYSLVMRSSMLDEMGQDYGQTARAKGMRDLKVRNKHVVPNALLPAVTQILLYFGFVISGALTVETVFSWPGLGLMTENAIKYLDYPLLRGLFLLFTASIILFNLMADVMIGIIDPRVREL
jgi:peptide/nickel transport system permease protein